MVRRAGISLVLALTALAVAVAPALAADTVTGRTGAYSFTDAAYPGGTPGARCNYVGRGSDDPNTGRISNFSAIQPPTVYAEDRTPGIDTQTVGWRIIIKKWRSDAGAWKTLYRSPVMKATADDSTPAAFSVARADPTMNPTIPADFYVIVKALWYGPNGAKLGEVKHLVANYIEVYEGWYVSDPVSPCPNRFPVF